jgi:hypothetical protein
VKYFLCSARGADISQFSFSSRYSPLPFPLINKLYFSFFFKKMTSFRDGMSFFPFHEHYFPVRFCSSYTSFILTVISKFIYKIFIIYSSRILCLSFVLSYSFLSSCRNCGTLSYSLCFSNQTDQK